MDAYVVDAVRTPRGKGNARGALHGVAPIDLVAPLFGALAARNVLDPHRVSDVLLGCVTQTGEQGANLAKIVALYAGWPGSVSGATVNRFCASGLEALRVAALYVAAEHGQPSVVVAGGVESMSRVPMFSDDGPWVSDPRVRARTGFVHMGVAADLLATRAGLARADLDALAVESHRRARRALAEGRFAHSVVEVRDDRGELLLAHDELPRPGLDVAALARFEPLFAAQGRDGDDAVALARYPELGVVHHLHHVGVSPGLADGAALVLVANAAGVRALARPPRARILACTTHSDDPVTMLGGNVPSVSRALERAGLSVADVDVFEVNESFAAVPLSFARALDVDPERLNPNGGAIALGHPLGATGGVLVATAVDELERRDASLAVVSIAGGAGVTVSVVIERVDAL